MKQQRGELPIDEGWAWVIVAAACCLFGLQAGGFKCQGILLVELVENFEGIYSTSTLIWIVNLKYCLSGLTAPLTGYLVVKFSHRIVAIIGVLLTCTSYIGLAYAPSFPAILLLHSIPCGLGEGMIFLSALLVSNQYFDKKKALALGIIASGSGIAAIILPHIYRVLFDNYSFSGACLLLGGVYLQLVLPACLYRPISFYARHSQSRQNRSEEIRLAEETEHHGIDSTRVHPNCTSQKGSRERSLSLSCQKSVDDSLAVPFCSQPQVNTISDSQLFKSIGDVAGSAIFIPTNTQKVAISSLDQEEYSKEKFNWRVILLPKFLIVVISVCLYAFGMATVYSAIAGLGKELGVPKSTIAVALMISGFVEIPCRISNGLFADKKLITSTAQYALALFIPGLMCLICAQVSGLAGIALVLTGMSTAGTSVFSLIPMVIIELVGSKYVTSGMSIQVLGQSLAFLPSSYITGAIYDTYGSWRVVFYYLAGVIWLSSTVVWPYCLIKWCKDTITDKTRRKTDGSVNAVS
ncbi:monocarboxylate transporter 12-like [Watersipora subatra]|uniref:monocarboxylate transporter 12-like n=1 Tax=Watersipora subatra TaxID=2589382 RepID=UPI00355ADE25